MRYLFFFYFLGKIRYRTRRIIAIVFFKIYRSVSMYVMRYLFFFCLSCRHYRSFVKECTDLLSSCTYTYATHTKVHAISVLLFCKFYLLIILTSREPMHFFFGTTKKVYLLLITMPPKKKPVNVSNKTKPAIVTVRKSSRTTPVKNKEKVSNILNLLFPCYYQLYAYSRVRI
jgi:hypothetical protein